MDTIYQDFANAIVMQAVKDYRMALHKLSSHPHHEAALKMKRGVELFFRSGWYTCLTPVDPEMLIARLNREVVV